MASIKEIEKNYSKEILSLRKEIFVMEKSTEDVYELLSDALVFNLAFMVRIIEEKDVMVDELKSYSSVAFQNVRIFFSSQSGLSDYEKSVMKKTLSLMHGSVVDHIKEATHLLSSSVAIPEYIEAKELEIEIRNSNWIEYVLETTTVIEGRKYHSTDEFFDPFILSFLHGCEIYLSNISTLEQMKRIIEEQNGKIVKSLWTGIKVAIFDKNSKLGDDFHEAIKLKIPCVTPDWIRDSYHTQAFAISSCYLHAGASGLKFQYCCHS